MYRICYIDNWQRDHQMALFHKWIDNEIVKKDGSRVMQTLALVEFEDGTMYRADYSTVRFEDTDVIFEQTDTIINAYRRPDLIREDELNELLPNHDDFSDIDDGVEEKDGLR